MNTEQSDLGPELLDTVVIGGGQAGLAMGFELARKHRDFVILDAHQRIGDAWRLRWDSLRLFTPAKYDGLPGLPFPGNRLAFPTKDDQADYLEAYAARFDLPVRTGVRVDRVSRKGDHFVVAAGENRWAARSVVVATGGNQAPRIPGIADELPSSVTQLHSSEYQNPSQLPHGAVLVVGVGNSGAEIALELSHTHPTWLAGEASGEIPVRHGKAAARYFMPVLRFAALHLLTLGTPMGRKALPKLSAKALPLIRTKRSDLAAAGVRSVPRVVGTEQGRPVLDGNEVADVASVIWCTGYRSEFDWLDLPAFDGAARPRQRRGIVDSVPGLYFIGQELMFSAASATLPGVGRDARYLAERISVAAR